MMGAYRAYTEAMKQAGAFVAGDALQPSDTATVVRVRDGRTQVLDGPYAEAKEQLAGYYLIEAKDLDAALEWAARCPGAAWGTMEVRPPLRSHRPIFSVVNCFCRTVHPLAVA